MGRYAEFYRSENCLIPEHKQEEFEHRVKQLFNAGGMMELDDICFQGKKATLIRPVELHDFPRQHSLPSVPCSITSFTLR